MLNICYENVCILYYRVEGKNGDVKENGNEDINVQFLIEENEGLRKGLQEIFNFLKGNCKTVTFIIP